MAAAELRDPKYHTRDQTLKFLIATTVLYAVISALAPARAEDAKNIFADDNLVAWCIVPFDAKQRGPAERAEMLKRLGIKHVAYDWRAKHIPEFEQEILEYRKHDLNYFAFWSWHESMAPLIRKHNIHPQIWMMMKNSTQPTQETRIKDAAEALLPMVRKAAELGCKVGIYNHGGWGGEPANMVAVAKHLQENHDVNNVGVVYNFHHGHEHMADFADTIKLMRPHLLCLNINGMEDADVVASGRGKILSLGTGKHERRLLKIVRDSGYAGPVGILDHRSDTDAEESLKANLDGLHKLLAEGL